MTRQEIKKAVRNRLFQQLTPDAFQPSNRGNLEREVDAGLKRMKVDRHERDAITQELLADLLGYGPLQALLDDPTVTEVLVNGPRTVFVEKGGVLAETPHRFDDEEHLRTTIQKMARQADRRIDEAKPYVDLTLPDGTRVNAVLPPVAIGGSLLTLRKVRNEMKGLEAMVQRGTLDVAMSRFLWACIQGHVNVLFSGATGAGKTTLLEVLSAYIDERERIVLIEDTPELRLRQRHVVRMQTRSGNVEGKGVVTLRELFRNALRMSPTRIILGEIRGPEAFEYLQSLTSGHRGSLAVLHASTPREAVLRLQNLVSLAGIDVPGEVVRDQIAHGLDVVVQLTRMRDGVRRVTHVSEVAGTDPQGAVVVRDLFRYDERGRDAQGRLVGRFAPCGVVPRFFPGIEAMNLDIDRSVFQPG